MNILWQLLAGIVLSAAVAFAAYKRELLSRSGVLGAMIVGTAIFGFGGWVWGLLLVAFFVLSSLLSHFREQDKARVAAEKFDKGGQRDLGQALANGGAGALIAALALAAPMLGVPGPLMFAAFVGALATVNADTWATEIGVLSRRPPRLVTTLRAVEPGTSGGASVLGTVATAAGGLAIGLVALLLLALDGLVGGRGLGALGGGLVWALLGAALLGGLFGSAFDSLLGATVQATYFCPSCNKETEKRLHSCGTPTQLVRGWRWLNNDFVNFISSLVGAGIAAGLWALLR